MGHRSALEDTLQVVFREAAALSGLDRCLQFVIDGADTLTQVRLLQVGFQVPPAESIESKESQKKEEKPEHHDGNG